MSEDKHGQKVITPAEREARKAFREGEAKKAMTDHGKAQKAFHENRERLKAARLAREATATLVETKKKEKPKKGPAETDRVPLPTAKGK